MHTDYEILAQLIDPLLAGSNIFKGADTLRASFWIYTIDELQYYKIDEDTEIFNMPAYSRTDGTVKMTH